MRERLGDDYVTALRSVNAGISEGVDFVMYWWDRAADLLGRPKTALRRFGLVTTNSITQTFNRRVIERHLASEAVGLIYAVPDHPWTKADRNSAAVRIAITVGGRGSMIGRLGIVDQEEGLETDEPMVRLRITEGLITPDLQTGPDVAAARSLLANTDLAHQGVIPVGEGFRLTRSELDHLGVDRANLPATIKRYAIGRDLVARAEERFIIDFYGWSEKEARVAQPALFQIVLERVKPQRDLVNREKTRLNYWIYAEPRSRMRSALASLPRYLATCRTAKHRLFTFLQADILPDAKIVAIALSQGEDLAILSSSIHLVWTLRTGAMLEDRPNYNHSECFGKFPFPDPSDAVRATLHDLGEELDATRKTVQAEHPDLTLTGLYNVLEKVRVGEPLTEKDEDVKQRGRVLILKDLHDQIDRATMQAYGWDDLIPLLSSSSGKPLAAQTGGPSGARERELVTDSGVNILPEQTVFGASPGSSFARPEDDERKGSLDEIILERLVALNAERAAEEAAGHVRWLRPDYQIPRFAKGPAAVKTGELDLGATVVAIDKSLPAFPKDKGEQVMAIRAVLVASGRPMDAAAVSRAFKGGGRKIEQRVVQALNTLVRYAEITALPNGAFAARRAA